MLMSGGTREELFHRIWSIFICLYFRFRMHKQDKSVLCISRVLESLDPVSVSLAPKYLKSDTYSSSWPSESLLFGIMAFVLATINNIWTNLSHSIDHSLKNSSLFILEWLCKTKSLLLQLSPPSVRRDWKSPSRQPVSHSWELGIFSHYVPPLFPSSSHILFVFHHEKFHLKLYTYFAGSTGPEALPPPPPNFFTDRDPRP